MGNYPDGKGGLIDGETRCGRCAAARWMHSMVKGEIRCFSSTAQPSFVARLEPHEDAPEEPPSFVLPADSAARKELPIFSGVLNYFPLAIAAVARLSKRGNDKHNPGEPLHWSRDKSTDHPDCIARHLIDIETISADGEYEDATALAWRALAKLQELEEKRLNKPMSRGSK